VPSVLLPERFLSYLKVRFPFGLFLKILRKNSPENYSIKVLLPESLNYPFGAGYPVSPLIVP